MPQVTLGLSIHRPEMTPLISDQMRRHDTIFLEEPPDIGFEQMLTGRLTVDDFLRHLFNEGLTSSIEYHGFI